jgi:hypothetical protein
MSAKRNNKLSGPMQQAAVGAMQGITIASEKQWPGYALFFFFFFFLLAGNCLFVSD